jgi:hypothetical protein
LGYDLGTPFAVIQNVPAYMRDVPIHPEDTYALLENNAPLRDSSFTFIPSLNIGAKFGAGIKKGDFDFNFGIKTWAEAYFGGTIERNYTNYPGTDKRGEGAALTYYQANIGRSNIGAFAKALILNFFSMEYSVDFPLSQGVSITNGWDRWNSLEMKNKYIAEFKTLNHTLKFGLNIPTDYGINSFFPGLEICTGITIPQLISQSDLAKQIGLTISPYFFIECQLGWNFRTGEKTSKY